MPTGGPRVTACGLRKGAGATWPWCTLWPAQGFGRTESAGEQGARGVSTGAGFRAGTPPAVPVGEVGPGLGSRGWQKPRSRRSWSQQQERAVWDSFPMGRGWPQSLRWKVGGRSVGDQWVTWREWSRPGHSSLPSFLSSRTHHLLHLGLLLGPGETVNVVWPCPQDGSGP